MDTTAAILEELRTSSTDATMSRVIAAARLSDFGPADVYGLACILAESGETLNWGSAKAADIASTGAPSSLSTLFAPLFLAAGGFSVVKLGVPGRPAGGIDVLAQIPGYEIDLDTAGVRRVVGECGYAHFLTNQNFAPLDSRLFQFRQKVGAQSVATLAAASLLAKKLACGVRYVGLDVRVAAHGNFGATFEEAARSAAIFREAAALAGIRAVCFLTDARFPYQPFIGRGEALVALRRALTGTSDGLLRDHFDRCRLMAAHVSSLADSPSTPDASRVLASFRRNIEAQGGSWAAFEETAHRIEAQHLHAFDASDSGFVRFDLETLRGVFAQFNAAVAPDRAFPDDFGVILRVNAGEFVEKGCTLLTVRAPDSVWPRVREALTGVAGTSRILETLPGLECEARG